MFQELSIKLIEEGPEKYGLEISMSKYEDYVPSIFPLELPFPLLFALSTTKVLAFSRALFQGLRLISNV